MRLFLTGLLITSLLRVAVAQPTTPGTPAPAAPAPAPGDPTAPPTETPPTTTTTTTTTTETTPPVAPVPPVEKTDAKPAVKDEPKPWRVGKQIGAPAWLVLGLQNQSRFEHLSHDFRANGPDDVTAFSTRTLLSAVANPGKLAAAIEIQDSRTYATDGTPFNTTLVNPLDLLEAWVGARGKDALAPGDELDVRAGRITLNLMTRRLVARNSYRNTINGFTGVDAGWKSPSKHAVRAFVVVPVNRLPSDAMELEDNELELDEENTDALLWSAYYGTPKLAMGTFAEVALIGFHERDGDADTRNRRLYTLDVRWYRKPDKGKVDWDVELLPQLGKARASTMMTDTTDLDHRALSWHAEAGISPDLAYQPRFALLHDYASGDKDPMDDTLGRFDNLFGARRFDFGPTGTYGIVARQNVQTPGVRIQLAPHKRLKVAATGRLLWLAASRDAWTTAGIRDAAGDSGRFIGTHAELQIQYEIVPKNLALDTGAAYLIRGGFAKDAPNTREANPAYFYFQLSAFI